MRKSTKSNEPWLHAASGFWCKKVAGKLHYLDRDYRTAKLKLAQLYSEQKRRAAGASDWLDRPFAELTDEYLDDIKARRETATYTGYRYRLLRALKTLGPSVRVGEVRRFHLAKIEQALADSCSPTTVRNTLAAVQAVFEWAVRNDLLEQNPIRGYTKPAGRGRNRIITPEEFQTLLRASDRNPAFRRLLVALRRTGCRPGEVRELTWEMVDLKQGLWIIPKHKTITTQRQPRPRIIPLCDCVWKLCRWLHGRRQSPTGNVFLNMNGLPYTKDRLVDNMERVRKRAGIKPKGGEQLVLYSARHTFGTEATGKVSDIELAELMGHTDTRTTQRYVHISTARLRDIQRRAATKRSVRENA